jgi:predicted nucleic acid-binding protein
LSELPRTDGNKRVRQFVEGLDSESIFLSVVTLGELTKGVALLPHSARKRRLADWLGGLERQFGEHILPIDAETARRWGQLTARAQARGYGVPAMDGLIAATAARHGLAVATHNTKHFAATGVELVDPWEEVNED